MVIVGVVVVVGAVVVVGVVVVGTSVDRDGNKKNDLGQVLSVGTLYDNTILF